MSAIARSIPDSSWMTPSFGSLSSSMGAAMEPVTSSLASAKNWKWRTLSEVHDAVVMGVYLSFLTNNVMKNVANAVRSFFHESAVVHSITQSLDKVFTVIDFADLLLIPIVLSAIGHDIYGLVKNEMDTSDFMIKLGRNMAILVISVVELLKILIKAGAIPLEALKYLTPFSLASVVMFGVNVIASIKGWVENYHFSKKMDALLTEGGQQPEILGFGSTRINYEHVFTHITTEREGATSSVGMSNKEVMRIFGVEAVHLRKRINDVVIPALNILNTADPGDVNRINAETTVKKAYEALQGRVSANITSSKLMLTNGVIGVVSQSVLFASPFIIAACPVAAPIIPALYAISGANACISLTRFIYDQKHLREFRGSILFEGESKSSIISSTPEITEGVDS